MILVKDFIYLSYNLNVYSVPKTKIKCLNNKLNLFLSYKNLEKQEKRGSLVNYNINVPILSSLLSRIMALTFIHD